MMESTVKPSTVKPLNLALQGGGARGAFTWGVIDRLLEDERLAIVGVSGASAGAVNCVAMASGLARGGRREARNVLAQTWRAISQKSELLPWLSSWSLLWKLSPEMIGAPLAALDVLTRIFSPQELNPLGLDPLRDAIAETVDFDLLPVAPVKVFISATDVGTGLPRVFSNEEISLDSVLASACLPALRRPVEIDGHYYWDGGFSANPPLRPLLLACQARDTLLVKLDQAAEPEVPTSAQQIVERLSWIALNQSLRHEIELLGELAAGTGLSILAPAKRRLRNHRFHLIDGEKAASLGSYAAKFLPDWDFLCRLCEAGREVAAIWLDENWSAVGRRSTVNLFMRPDAGASMDNLRKARENVG
jgi:NTE family protein